MNHILRSTTLRVIHFLQASINAHYFLACIHLSNLNYAYSPIHVLKSSIQGQGLEQHSTRSPGMPRFRLLHIHFHLEDLFQGTLPLRL